MRDPSRSHPVRSLLSANHPDVAQMTRESRWITSSDEVEKIDGIGRTRPMPQSTRCVYLPHPHLQFPHQIQRGTLPGPSPKSQAEDQAGSPANSQAMEESLDAYEPALSCRIISGETQRPKKPIRRLVRTCMILASFQRSGINVKDGLNSSSSQGIPGFYCTPCQVLPGAIASTATST